jgi:hypothetical protein
MSENQHERRVKQAALWFGGVLATVGTAFQIAGVSNMTLANVFLICGVWIFTAAEVWFSDWINATGRYKHAVVASIACLAGCFALGISAWIQVSRQQQAAQNSPSLMQLDKTEFIPENSTLGDGKQLKLNVVFGQHGPEPLHNVLSQAAIASSPYPNPSTDKAVKDWFRKQIDKTRTDYYSGAKKGDDVGIGKAQFGTLSIDVVSDEVVDHIMDGRLRIYVVSWVGWADAQGRVSDKEFCVWLQPPTSRNLYPPSVNVWHSCIGE